MRRSKDSTKPDPRRFTRTLVRGAGGLAFLGSALGGGAVVGCYTADFDDDANGVFACKVTADCQADFVCQGGRCVDDRGPKITIVEPILLQSYPRATGVAGIKFFGEGLDLVEPGTATKDPRAGFIRIFLDDVEMTEVSPVKDGTVDGGRDLAGAVSVSRDVHRLRIKAFRPDGTPFSNPSSEATQVFFGADTWTIRKDRMVSNPEPEQPNELCEFEPMTIARPHLAILSPQGGQRLLANGDIEVTLGATNFSWRPPGGMEFFGGDGEPPGGHAHVYANRDNLAECVQNSGCNGNYSAAIDPANPNQQTDDDRIFRVSFKLPASMAVPGPLRISTGLFWDNHQPFPALPRCFDPPSDAFSEEVIGQFVFDEVVVELVDRF